MSIFSDRLASLKQQKGALKKDIADTIGISLRAYQYYETDQREPTLSVLVALADYFDVSLDFLTGRNNNPNSHKL